ncbi:DUF4286 family protein [Parapedobacter sp. DT-150]|uniref:DUF4286 family protein n=1 Tax=Parapedobacter sp. DT-150 TaxID=3396162 RepID=UPI003F1BBA93
MYLYNVTIIAEDDIHEALRQRLQALLGERKADASIALLQLLDAPHEGTTYCVQLRAENKEEIATFQKDQLIAIQQLATTEYPGKVLFFDSMMKYLKD